MTRIQLLAALALLPGLLVPSLRAHGEAPGQAEVFHSLHGTSPARQVVVVDADPALLARHGFDLARHGTEAPGEGVDVVAGPAELARLVELGLTYQEPPAALGAMAAGASEWPTLAKIEERLHALVAANPDLLHEFPQGTSHEGRTIWTVRLSDTPTRRDPERPKVSINGNHHAREVMTVEASLDVLEHMVERVRAGDERFLRWISGVEVYVTPVANPDGYDHVKTENSWWRKNRRENEDGSFGVDLNRNYPYAWGANDAGSSGRPSSDTYRGPGAASEPETQALVTLAHRIKPLFNLSYHSYGEVLLYPYGYENAINPEGDRIEPLATELAARMKKDTGEGHYGKRSRLYPVNGLDRDWYYFQFGTYSFVPEISNRSRGFQPSTSWIEPTVTHLRGGWTYLLDRALGEGLRGRVLDDADETSVEAVVRVREVVWKNGEVHRTDVDGGFSRLLDPGSYHVEIEADGYPPQVFPVEIAPGGLTHEVFRLVR